MRRSMVLATVPLAAAAFLATAAAPAEQAAASPAAATRAKTVVISTRHVRGLGTILVDAKGRTLYMFVPDKRKRVTCKHVCAQVWPPVLVRKGQHTVARGRARKKLLSSDRNPNPSGGRVVTYARWPLYTYVADTKPGQAKGQALDLNGGLWYVLSSSGKVIKKKLR